MGWWVCYQSGGMSGAGMGAMAVGAGAALLVGALAMDSGLAGDIGNGISELAGDIGSGVSDFVSDW